VLRSVEMGDGKVTLPTFEGGWKISASRWPSRGGKRGGGGPACLRRTDGGGEVGVPFTIMPP